MYSLSVRALHLHAFRVHCSPATQPPWTESTENAQSYVLPLIENAITTSIYNQWYCIGSKYESYWLFLFCNPFVRTLHTRRFHNYCLDKNIVDFVTYILLDILKSNLIVFIINLIIKYSFYFIFFFNLKSYLVYRLLFNSTQYTKLI